MRSATFEFAMVLILFSGISPVVGVAQHSEDDKLDKVSSERRSILGEASFDLGSGAEQLLIGPGNDQGDVNSSSKLAIPSGSLGSAGSASGGVLDAGGAGGFGGSAGSAEGQ